MSVKIFLLLSVAILEGWGEVEDKGEHFVIGFLQNYSPLLPELMIIPQNPHGANVTITFPVDLGHDPIERTIDRTDAALIPLPASLRMSAGQVTRTGIYVEASDEIMIYGLNRVNGSQDTFLSLPIRDSGREYFVTSFAPDRGFLSQVGIVAIFNETVIECTIPMSNISLNYNNSVLSSGDTLQVTMDALQNIQLEAEMDLTGMRIRASKPVVVLSGATSFSSSSATRLPTDHFSEQLTPTSKWGHTYATVPMTGSRPRQDNVRVMGRSNQTHVNIKQASTSSEVILEEGGHADFKISRDNYIAIKSSQPVLVVHYSVSTLETRRGYPREQSSHGSYMLIVPSAEKARNSYSLPYSGLDNQTVNVLVLTALREGLLLNGNPIGKHDLSDELSIDGPDDHFTALKLNLGHGVHNISHSSNSSFIATSHSQAFLQPTGISINVPPQQNISMPSIATFVKHSLSEVKYSNLEKAKAENEVIDDVLPNDITSINSSTEKSETVVESRIPADHVVEMEALPAEMGDTLLNEAVQPRRATVDNSADSAISPAALAVLISLAAALASVAVCILGFLVAELPCRRGQYFRGARVVPLSD